MFVMNKVAPITTGENMSPFSAISGPLRALNIMGALPLAFHEDVSGKMKAINILYIVSNTKILSLWKSLPQISYSKRVEVPKILGVMLLFSLSGIMGNVLIDEANVSFDEVPELEMYSRVAK